MCLNKTEFLIAFVFQDLPEESHIMILLKIGLDPIDNGNCPLNDQILKPIFLVQVCIHILFHGFSRLLKGLAFLIEFDLLAINIINYVFELLESQNSRSRNAQGRHTLFLLVIHYGDIEMIFSLWKIQYSLGWV